MSGLPEDNRSNPYAPPRVSPASAPAISAGDISLGQYKTVRSGLQMIYYSIGVIAGVCVVFLATAFIFAIATDGPAASGFREIFFATGLVCIVTVFVSIVGLCMTLTSPRSDEKFLATTSNVCFFLSILGGGISFGMTGRGESAGMLLMLIATVAATASPIFFCLLLKRIGRNISNSRMQKSARSTLVWHGILFGVCIVAWVAVLFLFANRGSSFISISLINLLSLGAYVVILGVALTTLFKYLAMLRSGISELKAPQSSPP